MSGALLDHEDRWLVTTYLDVLGAVDSMNPSARTGGTVAACAALRHRLERWGKRDELLAWLAGQVTRSPLFKALLDLEEARAAGVALTFTEDLVRDSVQMAQLFARATAGPVTASDGSAAALLLDRRAELLEQLLAVDLGEALLAYRDMVALRTALLRRWHGHQPIFATDVARINRHSDGSVIGRLGLRYSLDRLLADTAIASGAVRQRVAVYPGIMEYLERYVVRLLVFYHHWYALSLSGWPLAPFERQREFAKNAEDYARAEAAYQARHDQPGGWPQLA